MIYIYIYIYFFFFFPPPHGLVRRSSGTAQSRPPAAPGLGALLAGLLGFIRFHLRDLYRVLPSRGPLVTTLTRISPCRTRKSRSRSKSKSMRTSSSRGAPALYTRRM